MFFCDDYYNLTVKQIDVLVNFISLLKYCRLSSYHFSEVADLAVRFVNIMLLFGVKTSRPDWSIRPVPRNGLSVAFFN